MPGEHAEAALPSRGADVADVLLTDRPFRGEDLEPK
jgi:hypothetical protein